MNPLIALLGYDECNWRPCQGYLPGSNGHILTTLAVGIYLHTDTEDMQLMSRQLQQCCYGYLPCMWPMESSLSSRSTPASNNTLGTEQLRKSLERSVNQPCQNGSVLPKSILHIYSPLELRSSYITWLGVIEWLYLDRDYGLNRGISETFLWSGIEFELP